MPGAGEEGPLGGSWPLDLLREGQIQGPAVSLSLSPSSRGACLLAGPRSPGGLQPRPGSPAPACPTGPCFLGGGGRGSEATSSPPPSRHSPGPAASSLGTLRLDAVPIATSVPLAPPPPRGRAASLPLPGTPATAAAGLVPCPLGHCGGARRRRLGFSGLDGAGRGGRDHCGGGEGRRKEHRAGRGLLVAAGSACGAEGGARPGGGRRRGRRAGRGKKSADCLPPARPLR